MMTSRSEFRLVLRQDNADERLTPIGYRLGLIDKERYDALQRKLSAVAAERARIEAVNVPPSPELNALLEEKGTAPLHTGVKLADLVRRPQLGYRELAPFDPGRPDLPAAVAEQVEIQTKYEGYIHKQQLEVDEMRRLEVKKIPRTSTTRQSMASASRPAKNLPASSRKTSVRLPASPASTRRISQPS